MTEAPGKTAGKKLRIIVLLQAWDLPMHGPAACISDPFLLYNHEQWAVYSYNLSIQTGSGLLVRSTADSAA
eukprot:COSAG01_NODE_55474_length_324_cov_7.653333_1_plen_71_part_10